jgi:hypothetical protein
MKTLSTAAVLAASLALVAVFFLAAAAEEEKPGQESDMLKPGPEHAIFKKEVGVWDATMEEIATPGTAPKSSKGVETSTLACGGLWLISDYQGTFMGQPFQGHGVTGYDLAKKKYVGTWVDGMSASLGLLEGTYDAAKQTMTMSYDSHDPEGNPVKMSMVTVWKGDDTRVWTASMAGEDGKPIPILKITYKRRK